MSLIRINNLNFVSNFFFFNARNVMYVLVQLSSKQTLLINFLAHQISVFRETGTVRLMTDKVCSELALFEMTTLRICGCSGCQSDEFSCNEYGQSMSESTHGRKSIGRSFRPVLIIPR